MKGGFRGFAGLVCVGLSLSALAVPYLSGPGLLIVQQKSAGASGDTDTGTSLANYLAQELDNEGRVSPIVWSMTDPVFRAAAMSGKLSVPEIPKLDDAFQSSDQLGAPYVIWYKIAFEKGKWHGTVDLYHLARKTWHDEASLLVSTEGKLDDDATWESMARTFATKLNAGPLKKFPSQPSVKTSPAAAGQTPKIPLIPESPVPRAKIDPPIPSPKTPTSVIPKIPGDLVAQGPATLTKDDLSRDVDSLLKAGKTSTALLRARDGVDAQPLNLERRALLIRVLRDGGQEQAAAEETRRLAELEPDNPTLRLEAAQAWIDMGRYDDAQAAINESLARDPNRPETRILQSKLALKMLMPDLAVISLESVIKQSPTGQAFGLRAVARALLGGEDGVSLDLSHGAKLSQDIAPSVALADYRFQMSVVDAAFKQQANELRTLFQIVTVKPKEASSQEQLDKHIRVLQAEGRLLMEVFVPSAHQLSHSQRQLAQRLLIQSLMDLRSFAQGGSEDSLTDARINFGEAIKKSAATRASFGRERGVKDDGSSSASG